MNPAMIVERHDFRAESLRFIGSLVADAPLQGFRVFQSGPELSAT